MVTHILFCLKYVYNSNYIRIMGDLQKQAPELFSEISQNSQEKHVPECLLFLYFEILITFCLKSYQ